jgi:K+-transporting ATPase ATPase C chain
MFKTLLIALRTAAVTLLATGIVYPLVVTGLAQVLFSSPANGSIVTDDRGASVGSELIGQRFEDAAYLHGRPSAAGPHDYDANASSGSNLGPTSERLKARVLADVERLRAGNPDAPGPIPADLVTASGSGLDPHVSPEAALWQVSRIARARGIVPERVRAVIEASIERPTFGILGEPRVNVLLVNLALDRQFGRVGLGRT